MSLEPDEFELLSHLVLLPADARRELADAYQDAAAGVWETVGIDGSDATRPVAQRYERICNALRASLQMPPLL